MEEFGWICYKGLLAVTGSWQGGNRAKFYDEKSL